MTVQTQLDVAYITIPTRYYEVMPENFFNNQLKFFTDPFIDYCINHGITKKRLQTIFVKNEHLKEKRKAIDLLNYMTSINYVDGFYLIFEFNSSTKQIKDIDSLLMAMKIINILKENEFEVHIGYCNTESALFTLANPDSISIGSYENLRSFSIKRFITQKEQKKQFGPNARLYSALLFQFLEYGYISAIRQIAPGYLTSIFPDSAYKPLMFEESYNWHFSKKEPYMHYFIEYYKQIQQIASNDIEFLANSLEKAHNLFTELNSLGSRH